MERRDGMSNPYDKAHELAKAIEEEPTYIKVKELTEKVMKNPEQMQRIEAFRKKQFDLHQKQMQGLQLDQNELEETNKLYETLRKYPDIKDLLEAEERLSLLFSDVNRILTGPLEKIYKKE